MFGKCWKKTVSTFEVMTLPVTLWHCMFTACVGADRKIVPGFEVNKWQEKKTIILWDITTDECVFFRELTWMRFIAVNHTLIMFYYKFMHPPQNGANLFWPDREDLCWIPVDHVIAIIEAPTTKTGRRYRLSQDVIQQAKAFMKDFKWTFATLYFHMSLLLQCFFDSI